MKPDIAEEDLVERIALISTDSPADRIDVDKAIRAGKRRRWHRQLAVTGAFACVLAATASVFLVTQRGHDSSTNADRSGSLTVPTAEVRGLVATADRLAGRWLGVTLDGRDISSWRDVGGLPASLIIGADGLPGRWQMNRTCGPLVAGSFTLQADGSFTPLLPSPRVQHCPMATTSTPDLVAAIARTAYITVDEPSGSAPRTLRFLDSHHQLIASWSEDPLVRFKTAACKKALGQDARADETFTTVEQLRQKNETLNAASPQDAFTRLPGGMVAIYCQSIQAGIPVRYAVTNGDEKARLRPTK
jgi:hypothetical protein